MINMTKNQQAYIIAYLAYAYQTGDSPAGIDGPDGRKDFDGDFDSTAPRDNFIYDGEEYLTIDVQKSGRYATVRVDGETLSLTFESSEENILKEVSGGAGYLTRINVSGRTITIENEHFKAF